MASMICQLGGIHGAHRSESRTNTAEIHDYYAAGGWNRYWGRVNDEVIAFYWSPDPKLQAYPSYKKTDRTGKEINVQKTPYGPGHIVPRGWMV